MQRAVCTLLARGTTTGREAILGNDLARLSAAERQRLIDEFVDATFAGTDPDAPGAGIAASMRALPPHLPDDPSTDQVQAWVELAELVADPAFPRAGAGDGRGRVGPGGRPGRRPGRGAGARRRRRGGRCPRRRPRRRGRPRPDPARGAGRRGPLADGVATFTDARVERYWQLLGVLNGWPPVPAAVPAFAWPVAALRAQGAASPGGR